MAGMLLKGGAQALVGSGAAAQPPLMSQPAAATTGQSASEIAFGPQATAVGGGSQPWLNGGGHQIAMGGLIGLAGLVLLYRSLPK
jgi:hypothetical protein